MSAELCGIPLNVAISVKIGHLHLDVIFGTLSGHADTRRDMYVLHGTWIIAVSCVANASLNLVYETMAGSGLERRKICLNLLSAETHCGLWIDPASGVSCDSL